MKKLSDLIFEYKGDAINSQWINDEKPVMTKDGHVAVIMSVDLKEIPNVLKGKVKYDNDMVDYEWDETGVCIKACDRHGNPKKPSESDSLVKAI